MKLKKLFISIICFALGISLAQAQDINVRGSVVDQDGVPVIGAGVFQSGKESNGTITDIDGAFSIRVPKDSKIVIKSLGFADQVLDAEAVMSVIMAPDANFLDEVVVVGYGVQRKSNLTGAISSMDSKDIEGRSIVNVEQALQGKTAGVNLVTTSAQPGAVPTVRIRGIASNGTSDPLYVVDGLICSDISGIDPSNIESMEILKDAASAAVYGAQAGNGVILITTKKGQKGTGTVTYDFQYSLSSLARKPALLTTMDYLKQHMYKTPTFTEDDIIHLIANGEWDGKTSTDWYAATFCTSPTIRHNVSIQGANDKGSVYLSLGSLKENGIVIGNQDFYKRITASLNTEYNIKPWLKVGATADFARYSNGTIVDATQLQGEGIYLNVFASAMFMPPFYLSTYPEYALPETMKNALSEGYFLFTDENGEYYCASGIAHPLVTMKSRETTTYGNNLSGTLFANLTPLKGLTVTTRLGYRWVDKHSYVYNHKFYGSEMQHVKDDNQVKREENSTFYYQWENFANYTHTFAGSHTVSAMVGMSFSENDLTRTSNTVTRTLMDDPLFADIDFAHSDAQKYVTGRRLMGRKLSYFGRLNYSYKDRYLLEAVYRADAADTSVLPAENRWGHFPSFSAGWIVSNEDFFKSLGLPVNLFKIRGSWGLNGSTSNLSNYSYSNSLHMESAGMQYTYSKMEYHTVAYPTQLYNPSLKWETSQQLDLGFDVRAFSDRFAFSFDWFDKQTKDLIINNINVPAEAGNRAAPVNAGNIDNRGIELDLKWKDSLGDFFYSVDGNFATLKNNVTYLNPNVSDGRIFGAKTHNTSYVTVFEKGYPIWYFRGYHVEGLDENGAPIFQDVDNSGAIDDNDRMYIGKPLPDFTYGLTLSLGYKGFDLTVFGNGAYGNNILMAYNDKDINYLLKDVFDNCWTEENPNGKYAKPSPENGDKYTASDAMLFDGSYFRIKQVQIGYSLPSSLCKKLFVERLRVYASMDNAMIFTSYPGLDPEIASNAITGIGIDFGTYPTTRKIVFGATLTF